MTATILSWLACATAIAAIGFGLAAGRREIEFSTHLKLISCGEIAVGTTLALAIAAPIAGVLL